MEENIIIEGMIRKVEYWREEREAREQEALKDFAEDSDERDDARVRFNVREEAEHPFPFTRGEIILMAAYADGQENDPDTLEFANSYWDSDIKGLVEAMRKAKVRFFIITNEGHSLMRDLWSLQDEGCTLLDLRMVKRENTGEKKEGIAMRVD